MPFTMIKGTFHVAGYSPDGDSIRFKPNDRQLLEGLQGGQVKINGKGHAQLRIEAIDTLETHYSPPTGGGTYHQPLELAHKAAAELMKFVGITNIVWNTGKTTVVSANDGTPGYILSRSVEKYGRPIAFVFVGSASEADGADVHLDPTRLKTSYNYKAVTEGLAYATFYQGLFADLRSTLADAARTARQNSAGVYAKDATVDGFAPTLQVITEQYALMPKLFRRLVEYIVFNGSAAGFKDKMAEYKEPVLDLRETNFTHFDTFIEQTTSQVKLTRFPEELVFDEMPTAPPNAFSFLLAEGAVPVVAPPGGTT